MEISGSRRKESGEVAEAERPHGDNREAVDQNGLGEEFLSKKEFCQDLEKRGLLHVLSSSEPEQLDLLLSGIGTAFQVEWLYEVTDVFVDSN